MQNFNSLHTKSFSCRLLKLAEILIPSHLFRGGDLGAFCAYHWFNELFARIFCEYIYANEYFW